MPAAVNWGGLAGTGLKELGEILDHRPASLSGDTVATAMAEKLLRVRGRDGRVIPLEANAMQRAFERHRGERNIVLKARQLGMTTWAAGRFFLKTITRPGTLTLQVAHTQEAAEEIFRIVHRFLDWLPEELRTGPLATSRANCAADCVSGAGLAVPGGDGGGPERGAGADGAEPALLGTGAVAGRSGRDAGGIAGVAGAGCGGDSGVDAARGGRMFLPGVA